MLQGSIVQRPSRQQDVGKSGHLLQIAPDTALEYPTNTNFVQPKGRNCGRARPTRASLAAPAPHPCARLKAPIVLPTGRGKGPLAAPTDVPLTGRICVNPQ